MNLTDSIPLTHFRPVLFKDEPLWKNYERINGFCNQFLGDRFQHILAKPVSAGNKINWYTSQQGVFKTLDSFTVAEKQQYLLRYHSLLNDLNEKINALRQLAKPDSMVWADMLALVFNAQNNIIYTNGENLLLFWGFEFNNKDENYIDPLILKNYVHPKLPEKLADVEHNPQPLDQIDAYPQSSVLEDKSVDSVVAISKRIIVRSNKKQHYKDSFLRNFWWVLILIPMLIYFLYSHICPESLNSSDLSKQNALRSILPSNPLLRLPLDSNKIIKSDSGFSRIVSDLFNIALKDRSRKLSDFAIDLKKEFTDSSYKIVFFDTTISRLQFQFPDSDRNQLKEKIKKKFKNYDLLIWDESVFNTSVIFNDPVFDYPDRTWYLNAIGAPDAWETTTGDSNIVLAIIDDGFDINNPDLKNRIVKPFNVKTRSNHINASNKRFHGTHVAGIAIGKSNNNFGVSGVAPNCSFMPIQISDNDQIFTFSDVIDGLLYAIRNGADVINLSLGKYFPDEIKYLSPQKQKELVLDTGKDEAEFWEEIFNYAEKENTTVVIAAGNQHILVGLDPMQRSNKTIKVSALNNKLELADFSNYGNQVTIYAPGEKIFGLIPGNKETFLDGTSMAAPIVSAAVGLMKSKKSNLSNKEILDLLLETSKNNIKPDLPLIQLNQLLNKIKL